MNELLIPKRYDIYMQDLDSGHVDLVPLGYVRSLSEAKTMVRVFREILAKKNMNATVMFRLTVEDSIDS